MRERPILFSAPMVRAILEGRKTQTRRVVKHPRGGTFDIENGRPVAECTDGETRSIDCPYGQPGDRLWVRETFAIETSVEGRSQPLPHADGRPVKYAPEDDGEGFEPAWRQPHYRATDAAPGLTCERVGCAQCRDSDMGPHWQPSIHMPRWASRITLEVTGVRVERLQSISDQDIVAEGVTVPVDAESGNALVDVSTKDGPGSFLSRDQIRSPTAIVRAHWAALWCSINGRKSWAANPWVWVVEFKRL